MDNDNTGAVSTKAQSARWLSLRGSGSIDRTISRVSSQLAPDSTEKNRRLPSCSGSHSTTTFWADSYPPGILADLVGLTALYEATGGGEAWSGDNWLFPAPVGEWAGVTTGVGGRVTGLDLHAYNLSGELPPVLGSITGLRELNLSNWGSKDLGGSIPPELGNLVNLTSLDLHNNQLTGEIPTELGKLPNLTYLNLRDSQLRGEIPPELGNLAALTELYLDTNNLTGALPPELGSLSDLNVLHLHDNQLTGEFPAELGQPPDLRRITLRGNDFTWAEHYEDCPASSIIADLASTCILTVAWDNSCV